MTQSRNPLLGLRAVATQQVAQWPQYAGHFDRYVLVTITKPVWTKAGMAFCRRELAIARPEVDGLFRTVWSIRNKCDTSVPESFVFVHPTRTAEQDRAEARYYQGLAAYATLRAMRDRDERWEGDAIVWQQESADCAARARTLMGLEG